MSGRRRSRPEQRGQAMVEYALIAATVVTSFAVASQLGASGAVVNSLSSAERAYFVVLPDNVDDLKNSVQKDDFNTQVQLR